MNTVGIRSHYSFVSFRQDESMADVYREMFARCTQPELRGFINEVFYILGISPVVGARFGCIELLLQMLNASQAHALLKAHASGKLQTALSKVNLTLFLTIAVPFMASHKNA